MKKSQALTGMAAAIALMSFSGAASALSISDTSSFGFGSLEFYDKEGINNDPMEVRTRNQGLALNGFDSSMGMLTGVSIEFESDWSLKSKVAAQDNHNSWLSHDYTNGYAKAESYFYIDMINPNAPVSASMTQESASCSGKGWWGASCSDSNQKTGSFDGLLDLSSLSLADFLDTVLTFDIKNVLKAEADTSDHDTWVYAYNKKNWWQGSVTVTYDYEEYAVAEPSAVALLGLGLFGLGALRRRRQAIAA
ncbi:choice-of-anchor E domain-containing protein [Marinobacter xestospongiae]|uniref:choice-of-anchor E domain-containing protein n=1 Tax=Marinobacter xestospongiae TaxID=994319 RepID=UPI0020033EA6|nr:choice-of-anchor E domain-containing protein [Marinobacter xestospongiae]MCK7567186.1 choice-of-anchor E domain-containing protein [Marinobacter xestospongiae]